MGTWSTTAPKLPSGSSWVSKGTLSQVSDNNYRLHGIVSMARGTGNTLYLKVELQIYRTNQTVNTSIYAQIAKGNTSSGLEACNAYSVYTTTLQTWVTVQTVYYTGEIAPGTALYYRTVRDSKTFGPWESLGSAPPQMEIKIPVFVHVGGAVHQADKAYINNGGAIKECAVYTNIGGVVKRIK